jgi:hypothetical protein
MTKQYCDRCKTELLYSSDRKKDTYTDARQFVISATFSQGESKRDICPICYQDFINWLGN